MVWVGTVGAGEPSEAMVGVADLEAEAEVVAMVAKAVRVEMVAHGHRPGILQDISAAASCTAHGVGVVQSKAASEEVAFLKAGGMVAAMGRSASMASMMHRSLGNRHTLHLQ